jgi:hypothetical protein
MGRMLGAIKEAEVALQEAKRSGITCWGVGGEEIRMIDEWCE